MLLKFLTSGALCTLLAIGANGAPVNHAHYKLDSHCHCPKGYEYVKGECVTQQVYPIHPTCPYDKYPNGDLCLKPVANKMSCPTGFELVPKVGCVDANRSEPIDVCSPGFFLRNSSCERVFNIPPTPSCSKPKEFIQNGECIDVRERPAQTKCQGTERKGKCFLLQEGNNVLECPVNFKLVGDRCEKVEFAQKQYVCHWRADSIFENNEGTHPTKKCPRTIDVACDHGHYHSHPKHRRLAPESDIDALEAGYGAPAPTLSHPLSSIHGLNPVHNKMCHKTVYYAARGRCPRGFTSLEGAEKYMNEHHYDKKHKPQCVRVEVLAPEIICVDKLIRNKCRKVVQIPFNLKCNNNRYHGWRRVGSKCVKIRTSPTTPTCPPNTKPVVDLITGDIIACEKTRTLPAKKECNVGFEYKHGKCVQLTIVKPTLCPHYAIEKHGECFVKADLIYKCPRGLEPNPKDTKSCIAIKKRAPVCHNQGTHALSQWGNSYPHGQW